MSTPNALKDALDHAFAAFESPSPVDEREPGFEAATYLESHQVQILKGCRALRLAGQLVPNGDTTELTHDGQFTVAIELSFNAIERSCQAALFDAGKLTPEQARDHVEVLGISHEAGFWTQSAAGDLALLFRDYRSDLYYREGVPSLGRAQAVLALARCVHETVVEANRNLGDVCLCGAE